VQLGLPPVPPLVGCPNFLALLSHPFIILTKTPIGLFQCLEACGKILRECNICHVKLRSVVGLGRRGMVSSHFSVGNGYIVNVSYTLVHFQCQVSPTLSILGLQH